VVRRRRRLVLLPQPVHLPVPAARRPQPALPQHLRDHHPQAPEPRTTLR